MLLSSTSLIYSGIVLVIWLIYANRRRIKKAYFAYWYSKASKYFIVAARPYKKQLFSTLKNLESKDPELKKEGKGILRILEVGVGPCCNLEHYPNGTRLITVDPNENFLQTFNENCAKYPNVNLVKHYAGKGEDMSQIADESVDVVVITYVLCSVDNVTLFLKEVYRVLVPGGKLYFMEHVAAKNTLGRWAQILYQPIWSQLADDCHLTVPVLKHFRESNFRLETHHFYTLREFGLVFILVWPQLQGTAVKPVSNERI